MGDERAAAVTVRQDELERVSLEVLEGLPDGVVVLDRDWTYRYVNPAAAELLGTDVTALLGQDYRVLYPEARGTVFQQAYARALVSGGTEVVDDYYPPWERWFRNRILPWEGGIAIFFSDVTEERQHDQELLGAFEPLVAALREQRQSVPAVPTDVALDDLERGIEAGEFLLHYQPVVHLTTGRTVGVEALARWRHPEQGLLGPPHFIERADESGLIVPLGAQLLREACRTAAVWGDRPLRMSVNLSPRQLAWSGLVELVGEALAESALDPACLVLEVTEGAVMTSVEQATATLGALRTMGVGVSLDDFGTGYSSLTYLKQLPVTELKVDRSFVAGLVDDRADGAIVASLVGLARAVGISCVAEGVERREQLLELVRMGCGYGQGWLWSPAMPAEDLPGWFAEH
jgi:EAL domain-containing protein (putative c-di-GMP-specific phosphodiesterase class I)